MKNLLNNKLLLKPSRKLNHFYYNKKIEGKSKVLKEYPVLIIIG